MARYYTDTEIVMKPNLLHPETPTMFVSSDEYEQDLKQARTEIEVLKAQLKEHEDKGLAIYGRKIDVLNGTVRVLEVKLEKAVEQRNDYIRDCYEPESHANNVIKEDDSELAAITINSIKRGEK